MPEILVYTMVIVLFTMNVGFYGTLIWKVLRDG